MELVQISVVHMEHQQTKVLIVEQMNHTAQAGIWVLMKALMNLGVKEVHLVKEHHFQKEKAMVQVGIQVEDKTLVQILELTNQYHKVSQLV